MPFQKGESGNPQGRPRYSRNKSSELLDLIRSKASDIVNKAAELALAGESQALKLILDRVLPSKPKDNPSQLH